MASVDVGEGVQIYYEITGTGIPVTAIACYDQDFQLQIAQRSQLLTFDQRGSGQSSIPKRFTDYSIAAYTEDLRILTSSVGFEQSVLIAHAQGAYFAIDYTLAYPERVASLILIEPIIFSNQLHLRDLIQLTENNQLEEAVRRLIHMFAPEITFRTELFEQRVQAIVTQNPNTDGLVGLWRTKDYEPIGEERLKEITVPTLVIGGKNSRVRDTTHKPSQLIPQASKWLIPHASHFVLYEQPKAVAEVILIFVDQMHQPTSEESTFLERANVLKAFMP